MNGDRCAARRTPVKQLQPVSPADGQQSQAPMLAKIRNAIFGKARRAELQAEPFPLPVIHLERQNPVQYAGTSETPVHSALVRS
jgi:hypothetical protein